MSYEEADRRFGSDKPDTRFGLEIEDATELTRGSEFGVFADAEAVRFLRVPRAYSRAELAALEEVAKERGAKGLAYLVRDDGVGEVRSPIAKFLSEDELEALRIAPGESLLFCADAWETTSTVLGHSAPAPRARARARRRRDVHVPLGRRVPDVRVGRGRAALERRPPSVHPPDGRMARPLRRGARAQRSRRRTTSS